MEAKVVVGIIFVILSLLNILDVYAVGECASIDKE